MSNLYKTSKKNQISAKPHLVAIKCVKLKKSSLNCVNLVSKHKHIKNVTWNGCKDENFQNIVKNEPTKFHFHF